MSENNTSGLRLVEKVVRVPVHPKHGCDIIGGIKEILDGRINTYHPGLGGILLDYSLLEIQPIAHNSISGMLYVPVHGRFQVFNVKPGDRLTGICTSVYSLKTGCHLIDVPVNGVHVKVRHPKEDPKVSEGDTVICEVTEARLSERMPLIRAKLVSVRANLPPVERVSEGDDDGSESGISSGSFHTEEEESSSIRTEDDETENRISGWFNATPQIRIKGKLNKYGRSSSDEEDDVSPPQSKVKSKKKRKFHHEVENSRNIKKEMSSDTSTDDALDDTTYKKKRKRSKRISDYPDDDKFLTPQLSPPKKRKNIKVES